MLVLPEPASGADGLSARASFKPHHGVLASIRCRLTSVVLVAALPGRAGVDGGKVRL